MLVKYTLPRPSRVFTKAGKAHQFIPGINELSSDLWAELMKNRNFKEDVEAEHYEVVMEEDAPEDDGLPGTPLATFENVRDAFPIIKDTYDRKLLLQWRGHETRKTVVNEIDAQLARIEKRVKGKSQKEKEKD